MPEVLSHDTKRGIIQIFRNNFEKLLKLFKEYGCDLIYCRFPPCFAPQLPSLQLAYAAYEGDELENHFRVLISRYFESQSFRDNLLANLESILHLQNQKIEWSSVLLIFVANIMKIDIQALLQNNVFVEATLQEGRIYWKLWRGANLIFSHPENNFPAASDSFWCMTWEQFVSFKDSGKRSGRARIDRASFIDAFSVQKRNNAGIVWDELTDKNIIDSKGRLSEGWRAISNEIIRLDCVQEFQDNFQYITLQTFTAGLKHFKKNKTVLTEELFCSYHNWGANMESQAKTLWNSRVKDKLNNGKIVARGISKEYVPDRKGGLKGELEKIFSITYADITTALNNITTNAQLNNVCVIPGYPQFSISRSEKTCKEWGPEGTIKNKGPQNDFLIYPTDILDVGIYGDFRNRPKKASTIEIEFDHIPSSARLRKIRNDEFIQKKNVFLQHAAETAILAADNKRLVGNERINFITEAEEADKKEFENEREQLEGKHNWWAVAIPNNLHSQGATYGNFQNVDEKLPFVKDVSTYLDILKKRPEEFGSPKLKDDLSVLGAFRYLYRCQAKEFKPVTVGREIKPLSKQKDATLKPCNSIGNSPHTFFNTPNLKQDADKLFNESIREAMEKTEGVGIVGTIVYNI